VVNTGGLSGIKVLEKPMDKEEADPSIGTRGNQEI